MVSEYIILGWLSHIRSVFFHNDNTKSLFLGLLLFWGFVLSPCFHLLLWRLLLYTYWIFFACFWYLLSPSGFLSFLFYLIVFFFPSFLCAVTCEAFYVFICSHILFSESSFLKWFSSFNSLQSYYLPLNFPINIHVALWHIMWFL